MVDPGVPTEYKHLFVAKSLQKPTFFYLKTASVMGDGNGARAVLLESANKGGLFLDLWSAPCDFTDHRKKCVIGHVLWEDVIADSQICFVHVIMSACDHKSWYNTGSFMSRHISLATSTPDRNVNTIPPIAM